MAYTFDESTWAACYDDKHPNNNVIRFDKETGEYSFIPLEDRKMTEVKKNGHGKF